MQELHNNSTKKQLILIEKRNELYHKINIIYALLLKLSFDGMI